MTTKTLMIANDDIRDMGIAEDIKAFAHDAARKYKGYVVGKDYVEDYAARLADAADEFAYILGRLYEDD